MEYRSHGLPGRRGRVRHSHHSITPVVLLLAAVLLFVLPTFTASAQKVVLKIRVINPSETKAVKKVSKKLPAGIDPKTDIEDLGGMKLAYEARDGLYYVHSEAELGPGETRDYVVALRDIWSVPPEELDELESHSDRLTAELGKTKRKETAIILKSQIDETLQLVRERQQKYAIGVVSVSEHVRAFERTREMLNRSREDIGMLENLAVGDGIDPLRLYGMPPSLPEKEEEALPAGDRPLVKKIRVENPAASARTLSLKVYLPQEVRADDVNGGDMLTVHFDSERGACYVARENIALGPGEVRTFEVLITNRWVLDVERIKGLEERATNLQAVAKDFIPSISEEAGKVVVELKELKEREGPAELGEEYIAFHHGRLEDLDTIESRVLQLEKLMQPSKTRSVFQAKILEKVEAPSRSSTWVIIYIILGFLAVVSLLFFLRWYGKSVDEKMKQ